MMVKIAMAVFSYYPADPRVRREAEALVEAGMCVEVFCLRATGEAATELVNGVKVVRIDMKRSRAGRLSYAIEYLRFIVLSSTGILRRHFRQRYDIVHVHNMPDILVIAGIVPSWTGARIVLDLHDPMPEVFMSKYSLGSSHLAVKMLRILEKFSISRADLVLTPNLSFRELFVSRGCPRSKVEIIMNTPQESIFRPSCTKRVGHGQEFIVMYHGTIVERHGLDIALRAISQVKERIPNIRFDVYGEGDFVAEFLSLAEQLGLGQVVRYHGHVKSETIAESIERIDVGIIPNKLSVFTNINLPTRIFEYLSLGKPVIAPRTKGIQDYFGEDSLYFFEPGDAADLAEILLRVRAQGSTNSDTLEKGMAVWRNVRWELQKRCLVELVSGLASGGVPGTVRRD